jgi:TPR repeat protein
VFEIGKGTPRDYKKAFEWYVKAANQGNKDAKNDLKELQYKFDQSKGLDEWINWVEMFANYGDSDAQNTMGVFYSGTLELDIVPDLTKAFEWLQKSASQGNQYGQSNLGQAYEYGKGVDQDFFKAVEWYEKAAIQGNAQAQFDLGGMYTSGRGGVSKDSKTAFNRHSNAVLESLETPPLPDVYIPPKSN